MFVLLILLMKKEIKSCTVQGLHIRFTQKVDCDRRWQNTQVTDAEKKHTAAPTEVTDRQAADDTVSHRL